MKAPDLVKERIVNDYIEDCVKYKDDDELARIGPLISKHGSASAAFEEISEDHELDELMDEFRSSYSHETGISSDYSRHYESKSVAKEIAPGVWVGWTYWYGGGKHGEPFEVPWIDDAYLLDVETVMEPVLKFKRREE